MNRKRITWVLIAILVVAWGINKNSQDAKQEAEQAKAQEKLSEQLAAESKQRLDNLTYGIYLSSTCELKQKLQPVSEVLENISQKKAIPQDLVPELELFNENAKYVASDERLFKDSQKNPSADELKTDADLKKFSRNLNIKTTELKQGMISTSNPYFSTLKSDLERIVQPVCDLAEIVNPTKTASPTPIPSATKSKIPGSMDSIMEEISKKVSYDSICTLNASAKALLEEAENAQSSAAFKQYVLESAKKLIYDLGYASFSFRKGSFYSATAEELAFSPKFLNFKSELEQNRYNYWATSSRSSLNAIVALSGEVQSVGRTGCAVAESLKKK